MVELIGLMTVLSLLPAALLMMTSFTRIVIVLGLLRQALGTSQTPSNQILIGLSLFLTYFVMSPVFDKVYNEAAQPYLDGKMEFQPALAAAAPRPTEAGTLTPCTAPAPATARTATPTTMAAPR